MRLVVADTSPINYLVLIGQIAILPALFDKVVLPAAVYSELTSLRAPWSVRQWIANCPAWLETRDVPAANSDDVSTVNLDLGEKAAIQLALSLLADLLLIDDRKGVSAAERKGLRVTGTIGILDLAAERGLIDFSAAIRKLERTSFRRPEVLLETLLKKHAARAAKPLQD